MTNSDSENSAYGGGPSVFSGGGDTISTARTVIDSTADGPDSPKQLEDHDMAPPVREIPLRDGSTTFRPVPPPEFPNEMEGPAERPGPTPKADGALQMFEVPDVEDQDDGARRLQESRVLLKALPPNPPPRFSRRPGFGESGQAMPVFSNHFELAVKHPEQVVLHVYKISIHPKTNKPVGGFDFSPFLRKQVFIDFLENADETKNSRGYFATDYQSTIISLRQLFGASNANMIVRSKISSYEQEYFNVIIEYKDTVTFKQLLSFNADENVQEKQRRLSIIFGRALDQEMFMPATPASFVNRFSQLDYKCIPSGSPAEAVLVYMLRNYKFALLPGISSDVKGLLRINHKAVTAFQGVNADKATIAKIMRTFAKVGKGVDYEQAEGLLKGAYMRVHYRPSSDNPPSTDFYTGLNSERERVKRFNGFAERNPKFPHPNRKMMKKGMSIGAREYLQGEYKWATPPDDKGLNMVNLGTLKRPEYFLPSQISPVGYQRVGGSNLGKISMKDASIEMNAFARMLPARNAQLAQYFISNGIPLNEEFDQKLRSCITNYVGIEPKMMSIPARTLTAPKLGLGKNAEGASEDASFSPRHGSWKIPRSARPHVDPFQILVIYDEDIDFKGTEGTAMISAVKSLFESLERLGLKPNNDQVKPAKREEQKAKFVRLEPGDKDSTAIEATMKKSGSQKDSLVILYQKSKRNNSALYAQFKQHMDILDGRPSICMVLPQKQPGKKETLPAYIKSLALKVNARFVATYNHTVRPATAELLQNTLVLGATILNPDKAKALPGTPSIVALMSNAGTNVDSHFLGAVDFQQHLWEDFKDGSETSDKEIVKNLQALIERQLKVYMSTHKKYPSRIVYYRSGLSDTALRTCFQEKEVDAFEAACKNIDEELDIPLTAIVVRGTQDKVKFYPHVPKIQEDLRNCIPGTVVDNGVVAAQYHDFYLQSHYVHQGTARPSRYIVARDDNNCSADEVQELTHALCYYHQNSTQPLAIPAPVYYAKLLASRVRVYLRKYFDPADPMFDEPTRKAWGIRMISRYELMRRIDLWEDFKRIREVVLDECKALVAMQNDQKYQVCHKDLANTMFWI